MTGLWFKFSTRTFLRPATCNSEVLLRLLMAFYPRQSGSLAQNNGIDELCTVGRSFHIYFIRSTSMKCPVCQNQILTQVIPIYGNAAHQFPGCFVTFSHSFYHIIRFAAMELYPVK